MSLKDVTSDLSAKARATQGVTHTIGLERGLRLTLRFRRGHYSLGIARVGVYPSVGEKAILRRVFSVPVQRKWRSTKRQQWHVWYIFWRSGERDEEVPLKVRRQLPIDWPVGVGPGAAVPADLGGPT